jgi:hypothetical protein
MKPRSVLSLAIGFAALLAIDPSRVSAHCDGMDGPVVTAAKQALDIGNATVKFIKDLLWR